MFLCLLILFVLFPLSATNVKWSWSADSTEANYYRYRLNEDDESNWTMVDSTVTSVILPSVAGINRLYLEASIDGIKWSEPAIGTYIHEKSFAPNRYEITLLASPFASQILTYTVENDPEGRASDYGNSLALRFGYNINSVFSLKTGVYSEYYRYDDFHVYHDFKADVRLRLKLMESTNSQMRVYLNLGGGADAVLRDDGEWGFYPLLVYGFEDVVMLSRHYSIGWGWDFAHTFQNSSRVFHLIPYLSMAYYWGGAL